MTQDRPNIILLSIDTLRADRMSVYGYDRPTTPNLERYADSSIICDNAFTLAPFTQVSCMQIFTSSRPLCYGGYDSGARGRPETLFRRLQKAGYQTTGLSTAHWVSSYYGYNGLDTEHQLFTLNTIVGMAVVNMRDTLRVYHEGNMDAPTMLQTVTPVLDKFFSDADEYCERALKDKKELHKSFPDSLLVAMAFDYRKVIKVTDKHRQEYQRDNLAYINKHLGKIPGSHEWVARDWRLCRPITQMVGEGIQRVINKGIAVFDGAKAMMRRHRFKYYPDAKALSGKVISLLDEQDPDKPFMIWAHYKDTHMPYVSGYGRDWYRQSPDFLEAVGHPRDTDPAFAFRSGKPKNAEGSKIHSDLYDASIRSTDEAIAKIFEAVDEKGLGENTLIVLCADHGEELGEHGDHWHTCLQYEHNIRVPMIFRRKGMQGKRIDSLVSLLDLSPTVVDLLGLTPAPDWEGDVVTSREVTERGSILLETFCRGNCTFEHRPVYLGVRSKTHKYIWKEYRDPSDKISPDGHQLYDLIEDPEEMNNLYRPDHPVAMGFDEVIAERLAEIPEVSPQRIEKSFGQMGKDTVQRIRGV